MITASLRLITIRSTPPGELIPPISLLPEPSLLPCRQQFLVMEKAQMAVQYEQREAARRVLDWQERGVIPPEEKRKSRGITLYSNQMKIGTK
jgi:hypothetical protein